LQHRVYDTYKHGGIVPLNLWKRWFYKMKRKNVVLVVLLMVAMAMSAFANGTQETAPTSKDSKVTVKVFHYMTQNTKTAGLEKLEAQFSQKYPNVSFENIFYNQGTDYFPQLQTALNSGEVPEIIMGNPSLYPDLIENGYAMDISEDEAIKQLHLTKADVGDCSYKGKVYSYPTDYKTWGVFYNKKIFEDLGIAVPTTASELDAASKKIEAAGKDVWADCYKDGVFGDIQTRQTIWTQAIKRGNTDIFVNLMNGTKKLTDYPYIQESLDNWATRLKYHRNDALSNSQDQGIELFVSGQCAMLYMGSWSIGDIEAKAAKKPDFKYGFFLLPTSDNPKDTVMNIQIDDAFMVNPKSPASEWAKKFMKYWLTDGGIIWTETTNQPLVSGVSSDKLSPITIDIAKVKKTGNYVGYGQFDSAYTSEYTAAWRKGLNAWAENVIKGGKMTSAEAVANIQKMYDDILATK